jgi:hypothetical protein
MCYREGDAFDVNKVLLVNTLSSHSIQTNSQYKTFILIITILGRGCAHMRYREGDAFDVNEVRERACVAAD